MRSALLLSPLLLCSHLLADPSPKTVTELKAFFAANCVKCHGPDGSAMADGKKLGGRDFTDAAKQAKQTDEEMAKTIRKGIFFGVVMPSFKDRLSDEDALLMVKEVVRKAEKGKVIAP
ncbi:MAG: c-type cytochrome [Geothrix sp.]|uniref:c-type cytochrome n=1 Tax=Geothrix sp. TaxID=1962974 RepID=UPI001841A359|nr:c-type cytochrome [Geothrix sp.]NWJ41743.1 c-type cytochrome [Geothrix sp.]WIL20278.1 MAG: c-type cytochrome [Geothrix sp.]